MNKKPDIDETKFTHFVVIRAEKRKGDYKSFTQRVRAAGAIPTHEATKVMAAFLMSQGERPSQYDIRVYRFDDGLMSQVFYDACDGNRLTYGEVEQLVRQMREDASIKNPTNMRHNPKEN